MNIVIYKGIFNYDVVNCFADELCKSFGKYGCNASILNINEMKNGGELIDEVERRNADLVIGFNGIGTLLNDKVYDSINVVFGKILVDHPAYLYERIKNIQAKRTFVSMLDEKSAELAEKYINSNTIYTHLMHGGSYSQNSYKIKKYNVTVFGGLFNDFGDIECKIDNIKNEKVKDIAKKILETVNEKYEINIDELIIKLIKDNNLEEDIIKDENLKEDVMAIIRDIDRYKRKQIRYNSVKALIENGIQVDYFGNSKIKDFDSNFVNHGEINYLEALDIMAQSKIIVHDIGYFKNGSHERIFSGMLNKALVISNTNNYSFNMYKDKESIVYYDVENLDDLAYKVKYYLDNEDKRKEITECAYKITAAYNTWDNRAEEILEIYNTVSSI